VAEQNYSNHTRWVPVFHFVAGPLLALNLLWRLYRAGQTLSMGQARAEATFSLLTAVALVILFLYSRQFALKAQDRVIRLEERLRMQALLPENLRSRIGEFSADQLIALRFASDEELPELARRVLEEKIADRGRIKAMVKTWRPDYHRV
jgi:hypothetical protein